MERPEETMESELDGKGFKIIEGVYSTQETRGILDILKRNNFGRQFGVREFLIRHPEIIDKVFTPKLLKTINNISPNYNKCIKSIFFNKPPTANWVVPWHQDLTINLIGKKDTQGFSNWRVGKERVIVQPTRGILENILTIRIHLDDCTKENGALRIIGNSHRQGVIPLKEWTKKKEGTERVCEVAEGGILIMRPLCLHSSQRAGNEKNRRVIHIELTQAELPAGLGWKEKIDIQTHQGTGGKTGTHSKTHRI